MLGVALTMSLRAGDDGKLYAEVSVPDREQRLAIRNSLLVLRLWQESPEVVRCSVHCPATGATAYLQGNEELLELSRTLRLELHR